MKGFRKTINRRFILTLGPETKVGMERVVVEGLVEKKSKRKLKEACTEDLRSTHVRETKKDEQGVGALDVCQLELKK